MPWNLITESMPVSFWPSFYIHNPLTEPGLHFVQTVSGAFAGDTRGKKIGIGCRDDISGELTLNVGRLQYEQGKGGEAHINIRYPVTEESGRVKSGLSQIKRRPAHQL